MPKWVKLIVGIALMPACVGLSVACVRLIAASRGDDRFWVALLAGAAAWIAVYLLLPAPMRVYVFGHELSHALWAWASGGKVKRFRVSAEGGSVVTDRANFVVVLAPYFFPVYAVAVVAVYVLGDWIWGWRAYAAAFHVLLGEAYAFHLTMTAQALQTRQTDITSQGYVFAAAVIWLGNVVSVALGVVGFASTLGWSHSASLIGREVVGAYQSLGAWILRQAT